MKPRKTIIEDRFGRKRVATRREIEMCNDAKFWREAARLDAARATAAEYRANHAFERGATAMLRQEHLELYVAEIAKHLGLAVGEELKPIAMQVLKSDRRSGPFEPDLSASMSSILDKKVMVIRGRVPEVCYSMQILSF